MSGPGCAGALRDGVLVLTLDTPGSSVNILNPRIAQTLRAELEQGLARGARAVVLASGKPGSFVNGVGLLLAASLSRARAAAQARRMREVYQALADAPVPTVAAVVGNCYGCGLELALCCDYRVAGSGFESHFYMPEIVDYRFIPLLGGTWRLPRLVGLEAAADLVIFGRRFAPAEALRVGLVDQVVEGDPVAAALALATAQPGKPSRPAPLASPQAWARVTKKIAALPPPDRPLARRCARLLLGALGRRAPDRALRTELAAFLDSVGDPRSRRAMSFFFVRQAAKAHSIRTARYQAPDRLRVAVHRGLPTLRDLLAARRLSRVSYLDRPEPGALVFLPSGAPEPPGALAITVADGGTLPSGRALAAYLPLPGAPAPVVELATASGQPPWLATVFHFLEHAGLVPVVTAARGRFLADRMIQAYLDAAARARASGLSTGAVDAALFRFGFSLLPGHLQPPRRAARRARGGWSVRRVVNEALRALGQEAVRALDEHTVTHPAQIDLLVRELFGFPLARGSLLRVLSGARGWPRFYG